MIRTKNLSGPRFDPLLLILAACYLTACNRE